MIERRSILGAGLAAIAGLFMWPFSSNGKGAGKYHLEVVEQDHGWRILRFREMDTWFECRLRVGHYDEPCFPAFGVYRITDGDSGGCVDLDWVRQTTTLSEPVADDVFMPVGGDFMFDDFLEAPRC